MNTQPDRPILVLLASHWISMLGATLVTLAGISWLFALPLNFRGHVGNPYSGLLLFVALPIEHPSRLYRVPSDVGRSGNVTRNIDNARSRRSMIRFPKSV